MKDRDINTFVWCRMLQVYQRCRDKRHNVKVAAREINVDFSGRYGRETVHPACKNMGDGGGGHWLVRMEWRPAGWSVCLPLLIFPCTIKSRSSLLAPAHPGGPGKRAVKRLWWCGVVQWQIQVTADEGLCLTRHKTGHFGDV